jgi:hypothetical protein
MLIWGNKIFAQIDEENEENGVRTVGNELMKE